MQLELGGHRFDISTRALVMGILNRTPDSFFDGGEYFGFDQFVAKAEQHVAEGADVVDVGGIRLKPGDEVGLDEELERVVPAEGAAWRVGARVLSVRPIDGRLEVGWV